MEHKLVKTGQWAAGSEPIPGYRLVTQLGVGGFGEVWRVEAPGGIPKAIKIVANKAFLEQNADAVPQQELAALSRIKEIRHPYVISIERFELSDNYLIIVMELADRDLSHRLQECQSQGLKGIPRVELLGYLREAAEALDMMSQEYSLQHLDIKPANLFLVRNHIKVADFGLVEALEGQSGRVSGALTPTYAAPETFQGWASRNSDQYSLAVVYQEMLTGKRPFDGQTTQEILMQHMLAPPDVSSLSSNDQTVIRRALAKDPNERFPSCMALVEALISASDDLNAFLGAGTLNSSTDSGSASGLTRSRQLTKIPVRISRPTDSQGTLCPTLILGLGGIGMRSAEVYARRLHQRFSGIANHLPTRVLAIDCDVMQTQALQTRATDVLNPSALQERQILACKLRSGEEYQRQLAELPHITAWMEPGTLGDVGHGRDARGRRPLGRLALADNLPRVLGRITQELEELLSARAIDKAAQSFGQDFWRDQPTIFVIAGTGGGTGAGMFQEICYTVGQLLREVGVQQPNVQGILLGGIAPDRPPHQQENNQFTFLEELVFQWEPQATYRLHRPAPLGTVEVAGPPCQALYFVDLHADCLPQPRTDAALDAIAEFLIEQTTSALGRELELRDDWPPFRSFGWLALVYPRQPLVQTLTSRCCDSVVELWRATISLAETEGIERRARDLLSNVAFSPDTLIKQMRERLENSGLFREVVQILQLFEERLHQSNRKTWPMLVEQSQRDLISIVGSDPISQRQPLPLTSSNMPIRWEAKSQKILESYADQVLQELAQDLFRLLEDVISRDLDGTPSCLTKSLCLWDGIIRRLRERADNEPIIEKGGQALRTAAQNLKWALKLGLFRGPVKRNFRHYCQELIEFKLSRLVNKIYPMVLSRLETLNEPFDVLSAQLRQLQETLREKGQKGQLHIVPLSQQTLFPGGHASLEEAVDHMQQKLSPQTRDQLLNYIREEYLFQNGGLWNMMVHYPKPVEQLAADLRQSATNWLQRQLPAVDVAQSFLDRHPHLRSPSLAQELESLRHWARPTFMPATDTISTRLVSRTSATITRLRECLFLMVPETPSGQRLIEAVRNLPWSPTPQILSHQRHCILCRVVAAASIGVLLPAWLLQRRPIHWSTDRRFALLRAANEMSF